MRFLQNSLIRRKMTIVILLASGCALLAATTMLFGFQANSLRTSLTQDIVTLAEVVSANCIASVKFYQPGDEESIRKILEPIQSRPHILGARILAANGKVIAATGALENLENWRLSTQGRRVHSNARFGQSNQPS